MLKDHLLKKNDKISMAGKVQAAQQIYKIYKTWTW